MDHSLMSNDFISNDSNEVSGFDNQGNDIYRPTDLSSAGGDLNEMSQQAQAEQQEAYAQILFQQQLQLQAQHAQSLEQNHEEGQSIQSDPRELLFRQYGQQPEGFSMATMINNGQQPAAAQENNETQEAGTETEGRADMESMTEAQKITAFNQALLYQQQQAHHQHHQQQYLLAQQQYVLASAALQHATSNNAPIEEQRRAQQAMLAAALAQQTILQRHSAQQAIFKEARERELSRTGEDIELLTEESIANLLAGAGVTNIAELGDGSQVVNTPGETEMDMSSIQAQAQAQVQAALLSATQGREGESLSQQQQQQQANFMQLLMQQQTYRHFLQQQQQQQQQQREENDDEESSEQQGEDSNTEGQMSQNSINPVNGVSLAHLQQFHHFQQMQQQFQQQQQQQQQQLQQQQQQQQQNGSNELEMDEEKRKALISASELQLSQIHALATHHAHAAAIAAARRGGGKEEQTRDAHAAFQAVMQAQAHLQLLPGDVTGLREDSRKRPRVSDDQPFGPPRADGKRSKTASAPVRPSNWTEEQDRLLCEVVGEHGAREWKKISQRMSDHNCYFTDVQCLHRWNKVLKPGLKKGPWTEEEDTIVHDLVQLHGVGKIKWSQVAEKLPGRIGKQCRERWFNHLDKQINKTEWDQQENLKLYELQVQHGNKWSTIAKMMPGRTENGVKNRFNSSAYKKWATEMKLTLNGTCIRRKRKDMMSGGGMPIQRQPPQTQIQPQQLQTQAFQVLQQQQMQQHQQTQQQQQQGDVVQVSDMLNVDKEPSEELSSQIQQIGQENQGTGKEEPQSQLQTPAPLETPPLPSIDKATL